MLENKIKLLEKAVNKINWNEMEEIDKPEVNEDLAYAIFGDDLSIEMNEGELVEMFLFEL